MQITQKNMSQRFEVRQTIIIDLRIIQPGKTPSKY